ncbi:phosphotransferase family protein [Actinomadura sp. 1N219]|uniref:phosphotransferase family protein n=1 Tax=Actinomadura sp. 1N219 TaxID=3375152 RepID=UPI003795C2A3
MKARKAGPTADAGSPIGLVAALREQIAQVDRRVALSGGLDADDRKQIRSAADLAESLCRTLDLGSFGGVLTDNSARPQLVLAFSSPDRGDMVLKVYGKQRPGEAQALRLWARHGLPAPVVVESGDDPSTWLLMTRVDGATFSRGDLDDTHALISLTRKVADVMAQAHALDGSGVSWARPLAPTLTTYLEASVAALIAHGYKLPSHWREAASLYGRGPVTLLHGDLGLGNVMRARNGTLCLLDPSAYRGHAAFDAARWCARIAGPDRVEAALAAWLEAEPTIDTTLVRTLLGLELLLQAGVREAVKRQQGRQSDGRDAVTHAFLTEADRYLRRT